MKWQNNLPSYSLNKGDDISTFIISHLSSWKAIDVTGEDKKSYLQGQLTCDVVSLSETETTLGAHCDAKGKVWSIFRLFHHQNGYALFQHASAIENALKEIKKYSVFSKVDISIAKDIALGVVGQQAEQLIDSLSTDTGDVRAISGGTAVKVDERRWLVLLDSESASKFVENQVEAGLYHEDIWDKYDIESAIPRITTDNQNEHIPQAFNLQGLFGINFSKGCYTGQETVARAKYRGTNKRSMFIVEGTVDGSIPSDTTLERSVGENWRTVGKLITHYSVSAEKCIGLIVMPNNLDIDTKLRLAEQPNSVWKIRPLPYSLDE
ncbi:tRNA-modifying protein YgfZ [Vibrio sp. 99-8-1]|uniref:tRNA-modifying protein YgfZ n=1 Tax=Vibrio sp. 99-8-1 TaxID=2607602 RepID=UPI001493989F|nr:tRNA-modifying protein YgfZ [Vibrio sp. 99-8-1]NOI68379.1 tRNA-modifying protein YgfZ [Vibrio sp. 99-8-1]